MKKSKVKQIFQQLLIAVVVFSLLCPGSLWAKIEKPGAKIIVKKEDGQVVKGELLQVEENSLSILMAESHEKVSISINEIDYIRFKRKSKKGTGKVLGLFVGGAAGAAIGYRIHYDPGSSDDIMGALAIGGGIAGAVVGFLLGASIDKADSKGKIYYVKGKLPSQIKLILKKLKKKARFKE